jgi:hypothetical protein
MQTQCQFVVTIQQNTMGVRHSHMFGHRDKEKVLKQDDTLQNCTIQLAPMGGTMEVGNIVFSIIDAVSLFDSELLTGFEVGTPGNTIFKLIFEREEPVMYFGTQRLTFGNLGLDYSVGFDSKTKLPI